MLHPDDRRPFEIEIERSQGTRTPFRLEYRMRRKNGTYAICRDNGHLTLNDKGAITRVIGFVQDIAQQKHLERIALQTEKLSAVGQVAAGVAHEINNPLAVILGFSQSLKRRMKPSDEFYSPIESIERESLRCKTLVHNLLAFSRDSKPGIADEDPVALMEGALSLVETQARVRQIEVQRKFEPALPLIQADRNQIQQVVINLCTNAMDAMPHGGKLTIGLAKADPYVEIRVTDTGTGIPQDIQSHIFEPFFTTKEVGKGTGLGLSLVHDIVEKHHGQLDFHTELGKGTTFCVRLPIAPNS